jgi:hypothetical protein
LLLDTRNKNIYGLGMGISTVFEIFGHFLYQGDRINQVGYDYTIRCYLTQETRNYGLGVGISRVFGEKSALPV